MGLDVTAALGAMDEILSVGGDAIQQYFFYKKTDKIRDAIQKIATQFFNRLDGLVNNVSSQVSLQQIGLLQRSELLLQTLQNGYEKELDHTVEQADVAVQNTLLQMDAFLQKSLLQPLEVPAQSMLNVFQMTLSKLPLLDKTPYVYSVQPICIAPPLDSNVHIPIEVTGSFPQIKHKTEEVDPALLPSLTIQNKSTKAFGLALQNKIHFFVPYEALFQKGMQLLQQAHYASCKINIPFEGKNHVYGTSLVVLPENPGTVTLVYSEPDETISPIEMYTEVYRQNSRPEKHSIIDKPYSYSVPQGYQIYNDPTRKELLPTLECVECKGKHAKNFVTITPTTLSWVLSTYSSNDYHDIGKIAVRARFHVVPIEKKLIEKEEKLSLKWGQLHIIPATKKNCIAIFHCFDGTVKAYNTRTSVQDTFVEISALGPISTITLRPPKSLVDMTVVPMGASSP